MHTQNPTTTQAWKKLREHVKTWETITLNQLFANDAKRAENFRITLEDLRFDFSKNRIHAQTLQHLFALAREVHLQEAIESLFRGEKINQTENRAVLHTALRNFDSGKIIVDHKDISASVQKARKKIKAFSEKVISGTWKGYTGKPITDIVNIGIGGSDLGPQMVVEALQHYRNHLRTHFISNIDGDALHQTLRKLQPETTLFIVVSKTFTTVETLTNAETCKNWFLKKAPEADVAKHFVAVSARTAKAESFGIEPGNVFPLWDWVGGRFSMWGSVGLSIALSVGYAHFESFLKGANTADKHFRTAEFSGNIPVIMGLLSLWYINFFHTTAEAVLPYNESLHKLVAYLQQLFMESNGKSVDRDKQPVTYATGAVIFGASGTNAQHSFMQHIHQGTHLIPVDFIDYKKSLEGDKKHHKILRANCKAQARALQEGKTAGAVHLSMKFQGETERINDLLPYKVFTGNKVSNTFTFSKHTPYNLGMLIALYEHKVFVQGILWNINSFDQFGVELGKEMARNALT